MSNPVLVSIRDRIAFLRSDMEANPDPRLVEIDALVEMESQYVKTITGKLNVTLEDAKATAPVVKEPEPAEPEPGLSRKSPKTVLIILNVRKLLRDSPKPLTNKELVDLLAQKGVKVEGKNPANSLSAILFNSPDFKSGGREGWTLASSPPREPQLEGLRTAAE